MASDQGKNTTPPRAPAGGAPLSSISVPRTKGAPGHSRLALPRYDGLKNPSIPVLDHRRAPSPFASSNNSAESESEDIGELKAGTQLSAAERARTIVSSGRTGNLALVVGDPPAPISLAVKYSVTEDGSPVICVGAKAQRAGRVDDGSSASMMVLDTPLTAVQSIVPGAVTMLGKLEAISPGDFGRYLPSHIRVHGNDEVALKRGESKLYLFKCMALLVSGGAIELERVAFGDYSVAAVDPLSAVAPGLASHLSGDQNGTLVLLSRAFGNCPDAQSVQLIGIDRFGLDLYVRRTNGREEVRLAFPHPVSGPDDVRRELNTMVRGARFKLGAG